MEISNKIKRFPAYQLIKNHVSREEMEEIIERYPEEDFVYLERDNVERIIALLQGQQCFYINRLMVEQLALFQQPEAVVAKALQRLEYHYGPLFIAKLKDRLDVFIMYCYWLLRDMDSCLEMDQYEGKVVSVFEDRKNGTVLFLVQCLYDNEMKDVIVPKDEETDKIHQDDLVMVTEQLLNGKFFTDIELIKSAD